MQSRWSSCCICSCWVGRAGAARGLPDSPSKTGRGGMVATIESKWKMSFLCSLARQSSGKFVCLFLMVNIWRMTRAGFEAYIVSVIFSLWLCPLSGRTDGQCQRLGGISWKVVRGLFIFTQRFHTENRKTCVFKHLPLVIKCHFFLFLLEMNCLVYW